MEFKNFTIETFRIPGKQEFMAMFKILYVSGLHTRFEWAIFDNNNVSQEGMTYNTEFSVKIDENRDYFLLIKEIDNSGNILSRSWDFVKGVDVCKCKKNDECVEIDHSNGFTFGSYTGINQSEDWNFGDWNWNVTESQYPSGWIIPNTSITGSHNISFPALEGGDLRSVKALPQPPTSIKNISQVTSFAEPHYTGFVDISCDNNLNCDQELDDLIRELEMMPINVDFQEEKEEWELEIDKIIDDLKCPFKEYPSKYKTVSLIEDYLGYTNRTLMIPIPPPLPAQMKIVHYDFTNCDSFQEELQKVRNKVMGRTNELPIIKEHRASRWFSLFR